MESSEDLIYDVKRKMISKYPRFGSEIAKTQIVLTNDVRTGSTDGKKIYINPEHFASVDENHKLYLLSHETCHKKFMHMYRLKDKDGNMRDLELWNIVCDAIVNANLKRDGIKIPDGRICSDTDEEYGDWVLEYNCEELYELKKKQREEQKNNQNQNQEQKNEQEQDNEEQKQEDNENLNKNENGNLDKDISQGDDHSLWKEAFQKQQKSSQNNGEEKQKTAEEQSQTDFDEKSEFEDNREEKREKFKARREKTKHDIRETKEEKIELGNIGESKEAIDWKVLLRREVEKAETIWSQRRSIAENNYAYRLEENEIEDEAETEIMIDVSGSVDLELVKAFLRQIKPILKQSKLKVGCFNEKFWGLVDIKSVKDIENFAIPQEARGDSAWTEDWDLAVRSFTKKREINKIVFTDGYPCPGTMPKEDLKKENIIWLVYGNKQFKPCCGKVINITEKQLEKLNEIQR